MADTMIDVKIEDHGVKELLGKIQRRTQNLTPAMNIIGQIVRTSIVRNFEKAGRPKKWKKHSKTTENRRGKGASILRAENHLMNSIHPKAHKNSVVIGTNRIYAAVQHFGAKKGEFGTFSITQQVKEHVRKIKGKSQKVRAHNRTRFSITQQVKEHVRKIKEKSQKIRAHNRTRKISVPWGDIPARPFMMVQKEDWDEIRAALSDYITGEKR